MSSISNSRVKAFRAYGQKRKLRDRDGLVLVEGVRLLTYILTHGHDAAEVYTAAFCGVYDTCNDYHKSTTAVLSSLKIFHCSI